MTPSIIARTDARTGLGLDEAIARGRELREGRCRRHLRRGAGIEDEFRRVGEAIELPLLANMVPTGKSPVVSAENLKRFGFAIAIYPSAGMAVACAAFEASYRHLKEHGSTDGSPVPAYTMAELHDLMGFPDVWDFEKRYSEV